jgi:hypothetical protein
MLDTFAPLAFLTIIDVISTFASRDVFLIENVSVKFAFSSTKPENSIVGVAIALVLIDFVFDCPLRVPKPSFKSYV